MQCTEMLDSSNICIYYIIMYIKIKIMPMFRDSRVTERDVLVIVNIIKSMIL